MMLTSAVGGARDQQREDRQRRKADEQHDRPNGATLPEPLRVERREQHGGAQTGVGIVAQMSVERGDWSATTAAGSK